MINRTKTLKLIKTKIDGRKSGKLKLKKKISTEVTEGVIRLNKKLKVVELLKNGNSVLFKDDTYQVRNINVLDTQTLHKMMWQMISDKEKQEIALEHLVSTKPYLED